MATNRTALEPAAQPRRVLSIDIFRGLTMLVMVFVNEVSECKGLPWWTHHAPTRADYMTYVDMVFPAFLFIVGMSIPLAIGRRIAKGDSTLGLWGHVLARALGLAALGLLLANREYVSPELTGMSAGVWTLLALAGAFLLWNVYPRSEKYAQLYRVLKIAGLVLMICAAAIFRRKTEQGGVAWLDFSYWEILGIIGWAYLATCILYIPFRKRPWIALASFAALTALNIFTKVGWIGWLRGVPPYFWPFESGATASIIMAGLLVSLLFFDKLFTASPQAKIRWAVLIAAVLLLSGWALSPLGISKNRGTPTWCLYSCAANTLIFALLYWIADVKRHSRWAGFVKPAGSNTLLTYLIPFVFYAIPGFLTTFVHSSTGTLEVIRGLVFTAVVLALAAVLTRWKVRLQL
jgi:predicted acyltransferase